MAITAIGRYFVGDPNIVAIVTTDDLATVTTAGYVAAQQSNIDAIQNGTFQWTGTDLVLMFYSPDQIAFFTYDPSTDAFVELNPSGGLSNTLANGNIFVGNVSNVATGVTPSGDITLSNAGVFGIAAGAIVNADVNAAAAIAFSKLATLATGHILAGNSGVVTDVTVSGDITIGATGITAIGAAKVLLSMLAPAISPAAVIKFMSQVTTTGGAAAEAITVTGAVAATDRAFVQMVNNGTNNVTIVDAVVTANTLTVTFSGDPGADTVINYQLVRATS